MNSVVRVSAFGILLACALFAGCKVQLVAPYDQSAFDEILAVAKDVDLFYGHLLETPEDARSYARFRDRYVEIEADIRSLRLRNAVREDNVDSEQIVQGILEEWSKYRERHADKDDYSSGNAELDRDRLQRMFASAASAEAAKRRDN